MLGCSKRRSMICTEGEGRDYIVEVGLPQITKKIPQKKKKIRPMEVKLISFLSPFRLLVVLFIFESFKFRDGASPAECGSLIVSFIVKSHAIALWK